MAPHRQHFCCIGCYCIIRGRLAMHMKQCKKIQTIGCTTDEAKKKSGELIRKFKVAIDSADLKRLVAVEDSRKQYNALKKYLLGLGHVIPDDEAEEDDHRNFRPKKRTLVEDEEEEGRSNEAAPIRKRIRKDQNEEQLVNEPELEENGKVPKIIDPSKKRIHLDPVRQGMQAAGLYRRVNLTCSLMLKIRHWQREQKGGLGDDDDPDPTGDLKNIARAIAFFCERSKTNVLEVNSDRVVINLLKRSAMASWLNKIAECGAKGETLRLKIRALIVLKNFFLTNCDITFNQKQKLELCGEYLKSRSKGITKKIRHEQRKKMVNEYESGVKYDYAEVVKVLEGEECQKKLEAAKTEIEEYDRKKKEQPELVLPFKPYQFIARYCMALLQLKYGLRPQVAKNMTMGEWRARKFVSSDFETVTSFGVAKHKTAQSRLLQRGCLEEDEELLFRFYSKCRRMLVDDDGSKLHSKMAPFFINYKNKSKFTNPSREVIKLQVVQLGMQHHYTSRATRIIIQTAAANTFLDQPEILHAIAEQQGHTQQVARCVYTRPTPDDILPAHRALKRLAISSQSEVAGAASPVKHIRFPDSDNDDASAGASQYNEVPSPSPKGKDEAGNHIRFPDSDNDNVSASASQYAEVPSPLAEDQDEAGRQEESPSSSQTSSNDWLGSMQQPRVYKNRMSASEQELLDKLAEKFTITMSSAIPSRKKIQTALDELQVGQNPEDPKMFWDALSYRQRKLRWDYVCHQILEELKTTEMSKEDCLQKMAQICKQRKWRAETGRMLPCLSAMWKTYRASLA